MNGKEVLLVVETVAHEKGVPKEVIFEAIELALATATKKKYSEEAEFRVAIELESDDYETFRTCEVVNILEVEEFNSEANLTVDQAEEKDESLKLGDFYEIPVDSVDFGRIAAQTA